MALVILGIDPGKNVCGLVGLDSGGAVVPRRRLRRGAVVSFVLSLPRCAVAMEACCGAHHLGRVFEEAGLEARLMSSGHAPMRRRSPCRRRRRSDM